MDTKSKNSAPDADNKSPKSCQKELKKPGKDDVDQTLENPDENKEAPKEALSEAFECPVCLQNCSFPVQLPCKHIFCFLCVKGVAHRSKRCALCRTEIPVDFFRDPKLIREVDFQQTATHSFDEGYQWFYEGRNGWWQYDERTSIELEARYKKEGSKVFELLIAGFLYVIDLENMMQCRRNDQTRRRRIRRDLRSIPGIKGIAGLKYTGTQASRPSGDGGETSSAGNTGQATQIPPIPAALPPTDSSGPLRDHDTYLAPPAPNNTPQTPQTPADSPPSSVSSSEQDLSMHLQNLNLNENSPPRGLPRPEFADATIRAEYSDSGDSDADDEVD